MVVPMWRKKIEQDKEAELRRVHASKAWRHPAPCGALPIFITRCVHHVKCANGDMCEMPK